MPNSSASILVVVPTYNERDNIAAFVNDLFRVVPHCHILIVDDNSPDGTGKVAEELAFKKPAAIHVIHRPSKKGLGSAYRDVFMGSLLGSYEIIVQMDSDMSHQASSLPSLVRALQSNHLAIGSRYIGGVRVLDWEFRRLLLSKAATCYARCFTGMGFADITSGFRAWRREAVSNIRWEDAVASGYMFQVESLFLAVSAGLSICEVPIIYLGRQKGSSKLEAWVLLEAILRTPMIGLRRICRLKLALWMLGVLSRVARQN